ncbi:hypothetical protein DCAR_0104438 [Daucus carota subsp. sativus]|uniref:Uncharacterized protein n=1 Tax=Daucus carota subsp. sativus TaxID=79200 RepID=A0A166IUG1_DAUCS|nr:PREDICTED: uncharacterized protein LOC108196613 [Daucus carota subsp. sativus]XP_017219473.1 PREDICTED: uncharacterized protein LOC108196613 [Daucus carota subsp. sativus]WOG85250.1 hypothetical protein DCAR_0104438 [Daucus carota subsp. sativus]
MADLLPKAWKSLWDVWDLRSFIFLSLFLQTLLVLVAPLRKKTSHGWIIVPLWSAYLLADWAANFAVGLIASSNSDPPTKDNSSTDYDLYAFWAPFLLVHLGGPDTITAFALEDNELWLRHLFGLLFQCIAVIYVFIQALPVKENLWIPTLLVFLSGIIKYAERTRSLYLASASSFRDSMLTEPDPGPNYAKLMDEYHSKKIARLPTRIEMLAEPDRVIKAANRFNKDDLTDLQVVQYAYRYFETFKGLVVGLIFSFRERNQSRDFFLARSAEDAFRVVEVELNFLYEVLFTKLPVVYDGLGYCCRCISSVAVIMSFVLFYYIDKENFQGFDVGVTYTLLLGAITLDVIAFAMLIFSDWTTVALRKSPDPDNSSTKSRSYRLRSWLLEIKTRKLNLSCFAVSLPIISRRWAETMSTYNLIYYCLNRRPRKRELIYDYMGLTTFLDEIWYVDCAGFDDKLRDFIFAELKGKSQMADDLETAREICSAKGEWVLRIKDYGRKELLPFVVDVDYDQSLLLWHIATDLCYNDKEDKPLNKDYRDIAKLISDYMIYLLVMQPNMMAAVAGIGLIRFRDTCAEASKFFKNSNVALPSNWFSSCFGRAMDPGVLQLACESILAVNTEVEPITIKGDRSKSVLFDAAILAHTLRKLPQKDTENGKVDKWFIISKVWVELLSFAATHIRSDSHAQQLSKGGDLITIVWLLMAHFGLGDQFQINEGHARAKLIVGK